MELPNQLHEVKGNHQVAIDRTKDILKYVDKAILFLEQAMNKTDGSYLRAGNLRQGDDYLDAIIRFAKCAKQELRIAYGIPSPRQPMPVDNRDCQHNDNIDNKEDHREP